MGPTQLIIPLLPLLGFGPAGCAERFNNAISVVISRRCHQAAVTRGRCVVSYVVILVWGHAEHHLVIGDLLR